jgi:hypothetical protein
VLALQQSELLAGRKVFEHQAAARTKNASHGSEPESKEVEHGGRFIADQTFRLRSYLVGSTAERNCDEAQYLFSLLS